MKRMFRDAKVVVYVTLDSPTSSYLAARFAVPTPGRVPNRITRVYDPSRGLVGQMARLAKELYEKALPEDQRPETIVCSVVPVPGDPPEMERLIAFPFFSREAANRAAIQRGAAIMEQVLPEHRAVRIERARRALEAGRASGDDRAIAAWLEAQSQEEGD